MNSTETEKKEVNAITFPEYIVPAKTKGAKTKEECDQHKWAMDYMQSLFRYSNFTQRKDIKRLYQYAEAKVDVSEFDHITKFYCADGSGIEKVIPAYIRDVNLIPSVLNRLIGEANTQPLKYSVNAVNADAVIQKLEKFVGDVSEKVARMTRQNSGIDKLLGTPLYEEDEQIVLPKEIEEMSFANYRENDEIMMQKGLNYLMKKTGNSNLRYKLTNQCYKDYLTCSEMAAHAFVDMDDPNIERIDPRDLGYILSPNSPFIHHGMAAWYYFYDTPQGMIDRFPDLSEEHVMELKNLASSFKNGDLHSGNIDQKCSGGFIQTENGFSALYIRAMFANWRAGKRVRVKINVNKFDKDNPHVHFVDDSDNSPNSKYESRYYTELWQGYMIGTTIFHKLDPLPGQNMVGDSPREKDLNIIGIVDSTPSIAALIQPIQALRIQAFYAVERLMSQIQGNVLVIDESIDSNSENNLYNMRVNGIWKINTAQEGDLQLGTSNPNAMKPQVMDMAGSVAIQQLMNFISFLDMNTTLMTGINDARQGFLKSDTGLGLQQNATIASQMTTQPYTTTWYMVCQIALQKMLDLMKPAWSGKEYVRYFMGDAGFELLNIKNNGWESNVYGVFIENSASDEQLKAKVIAMAERVLPTSNDPDMALAVIEMINGSNSNEAIRIFRQGVENIKKVQAQQQEQAAAMQQQQQQVIMGQAQVKAQTEAQKVQGGITEATIAANAQIKTTEMKIEGKGELTDVQKQNKMDEMLAQNELAKGNQKINVE